MTEKYISPIKDCLFLLSHHQLFTSCMSLSLAPLPRASNHTEFRLVYQSKNQFLASKINNVENTLSEFGNIYLLNSPKERGRNIISVPPIKSVFVLFLSRKAGSGSAFTESKIRHVVVAVKSRLYNREN